MFDGGPQFVLNLSGGPGFRVHQFGGTQPRRRPRESSGPSDQPRLLMVSAISNLLLPSSPHPPSRRPSSRRPVPVPASIPPRHHIPFTAPVRDSRSIITLTPTKSSIGPPVNSINWINGSNLIILVVSRPNAKSNPIRRNACYRTLRVGSFKTSTRFVRLVVSR